MEEIGLIQTPLSIQGGQQRWSHQQISLQVQGLRKLNSLTSQRCRYLLKFKKHIFLISLPEKNIAIFPFMHGGNCFIHRTVGHLVNDVIYFEWSRQYFSSKSAFLKKSGNVEENLPNDTRIKQMEWGCPIW